MFVATENRSVPMYACFTIQVTMAVPDWQYEKTQKNLSRAKCFIVATSIVLPILSPPIIYAVGTGISALLFFSSARS